MARIRTIKPEFWTDERVGESSVSARLLFLASLNFADDHGGLDRSAKQLKAQAFPYDQIDCEPLVQELIKVGLFLEYEVGGKKYLHIKGFRLHQKVEKPARNRVPLYEPSVSPPRVLPEPSPGSSGSSLGREGNGMEGKPKSARSAPLVLHESLPTEEWAQWLEFRRTKRWPLDDVTLRKQLNELKRADTPTQREMINRSINAGWQGIFPPRGSATPANGSAPERTWRPDPEDDRA